MTDKRAEQLDVLDTDEVARDNLLTLINNARSLSEQGGQAFSPLHQADFFANVDKVLGYPVVEESELGLEPAVAEKQPQGET